MKDTVYSGMNELAGNFFWCQKDIQYFQLFALEYKNIFFPVSTNCKKSVTNLLKYGSEKTSYRSCCHAIYLAAEILATSKSDVTCIVLVRKIILSAFKDLKISSESNSLLGLIYIASKCLLYAESCHTIVQF